ncbi:hypothetical protein ASG43_04795 [Aureimonas sp. Leaf454]|uniref:acyl carrier protein n=1 Tax=Aureimonas sp. Leaf454 TaxID=1736381 RepID=UPI0006FF5018|nr:acyl carrier protein [Aureimonas sp. Leaf454]KQT54863.1 hypothetical protein ASG43_04795 [Aureimonas sp. Leaf454]
MPQTFSRDLADRFASLLRMPVAQIDTTANVLDLGADSIMLLEARTAIEARYGQRIEIRRFFEDLTTIDAIADFLAAAAPAAGGQARAEPLFNPPSVEPVSVDDSRPSARPAPDAAAPAALEAADLRLMQAQLALVAEVIESQNRFAGARRRRAGIKAAIVASGTRDAATAGATPSAGEGPASQGIEVDAA